MPVNAALGFSVSDTLSRSDVGLRPRHGDELLARDCGHLPLFHLAKRNPSTVPSCEAGGGGRIGATPLSKGHIPYPSESQCLARTESDMFRVWLGGSTAEFPAIPSDDPRMSVPQRRTDSKRGRIHEFSAAARRRLQHMLATITFATPAYTMALTLPGDLSCLSHAVVKHRFLRLLDAIHTARPDFMCSVGLLWKQELQTRGALHFHLLLYGVTEETRRDVQRWVAERWCALVASYCSADERAKHLWWHLRDGHDGKRRGARSSRYDSGQDNMQAVRNFAGYFSKYLGKDEASPIAAEPIPGQWWGCICRTRIPWADMREIALPVRMRIHMQRIARKVRQKRADAAKHAAVCRKSGLSWAESGVPLASQFDLTCGRHRKGTELGDCYRAVAAKQGLRFGRYAFPPSLKYSTVRLIGEHVPELARRISEYAVSRFRHELANTPF